MPLYGYTPPEPEYTLDPATGTYVPVKKPVMGQYVNAQGVATSYQSEGVMPYMNDGSLKPEFAGQYPGQVGVPDPSHVPQWAGGTQAVNPEKPSATVAPTTEEALKYGAEIGRLQSAIDTLQANIASGKGDIVGDTKKLISYSQRLAALVTKAKGTANPALATTPAEAVPANTNPNNAPAGPAGPPPTDLLVGPASMNQPAPAPDYQKASDTNIQYAKNMQDAAQKEKDKARREALMKRAAQYSKKAQDYGTKVTLKSSTATSTAPATGTTPTTGGTTNA